VLTERPRTLDENLVAYSFTKEGETFLFALKREHYKAYKETINKEKLDKIFRFPATLVLIKAEEDGTFTRTSIQIASVAQSRLRAVARAHG